MASQTLEIAIPGFDVPAFLVTPDHDSASAGVIFLHWFDESPDANRSQFLDEATELAGSGVVSLLPQLHFPWEEAPSGATADRALIEHEVELLGAAVEVLSSRTGEAPTAMVGHDFGAMHGTLLMRKVEFACGVVIAATPRWSDWFLRFWPIEDDRFEYGKALDPLDPVNAVREIEAPLLFQFARGDFYIAPMTGLELFEAKAEPRALESYDGDHSMKIPKARSDRLDFLTANLGL